MKIKVFNGLKTVSHIDAITEARIHFNGKEERLVAIARNNSVVNGLLFHVDDDKSIPYGIPQQNDIFIGNLSNEVAQNYLETLGKEDYLDLSCLDYQEAKSFPTDYTFDSGKSKPYMCDGNIAMYTMINAVFSPFASEPAKLFDDEEDEEEECNE